MNFLRESGALAVPSGDDKDCQQRDIEPGGKPARNWMQQ